VNDRQHQPAHALHVLVARLDRAADRILREHLGLGYARHLLMLTLQRLGSATQRELAAELGLSEPSVSRSIPQLAAEGWVTVTTVAGGGNRRQVQLTMAGERLVDEAAELLEGSFSRLLDAAGLRPSDVLGVTDPLLAALEPDDGSPS
jgi:DNA-binding MarR family transcriptional regulator